MPTRGARPFARLVPHTPLGRKLASQSMLFSAANGTFMTGSAVFFTQVVGLSAAQVGLGLSIAGVVSFLVAYPAGRLADAFGPKRMWALGAFAGALMFGLWPFISGFAAYVAVTIAFEIVQNAGGAGYGAYVLDVMPEEERVETQAYLYSALNVGFTIGAIIGGIALAFDNLTLLRWLPLLTLALGLVNAIRIWSLPHAPHDLAVAQRVRGQKREKVPGKGPLHNVGWLALSVFNGTLWTNQVLLNVVIPLWLVQETDSPHWLLAWLFGTNTVLCIFLPAYTSKGVHNLTDALRRVRISTVFFVGSCLITMVTHSTAGFLTVLLVWLGHVTVTGAELAISSASWQFQAALMDPRRRGEYGGAAEVCATVGRGWAPALYTWLAIEWHHVGWLVIAGIAVVATIGMHPAARAAERFLARELPDPDSPGPQVPDAGPLPEAA